MTINLTGREPKPRVINVKQYSAGVDTVSFAFDEARSGTVSVVGDTYKQSISDGVWTIPASFTARSGCFDIQLECVDDETVWKSDVMLLIVSASTSGEQSPETSGGYGEAGNCTMLANGIADDGIAGEYTTVEEYTGV